MRGQCVKCGGNRVSGPHYNRAHNTLKYVCQVCGYDWERPTCDQEKPAGNVNEWVEAARKRGGGKR